jgi:hypothetical protein
MLERHFIELCTKNLIKTIKYHPIHQLVILYKLFAKAEPKGEKILKLYFPYLDRGDGPAGLLLGMSRD